MSMPKVTIVAGVVLILLSVVGVAGAVMHGKSFMTALIPFIFGDLLIALGAFSLKSESLRKHLMHGAAMVALLAAIGALVPMILRGSQMSALSWVCIGGQFLVGAILEVLYVRSFIAVRKAREVGAMNA